MSLGIGWKSSCARLSKVTSSSSTAVASGIASTAATPAPLTQRWAIELFICLKISPERHCAETELTFAVSVELFRDVLDILALHQCDVRHRFFGVQRRCRAYRAIAAVRLRGSLHGLFQRHLGFGHGLALFLGVFRSSASVIFSAFVMPPVL